MTSLAPQSRYRIYGSTVDYIRFFYDSLIKRNKSRHYIELFEQEIGLKFNVSYAACVPMARVGIYLTLKALIQPGQKVILSPYTIADVINMVISAGGKPVFADIERHTCNISASQVRELIDKDTGAVMITHLHGLAAPVKDIKAICDEFNVPMIEDSAQAFGTRVGGQHTGTFGTAGIFSIGMYKNINTWYGGLVVSDNKALVDKVKAELANRPYQTPGFIFKKLKKALLTDIVTWPLIFKVLTFWIFRFGFLKDIEWINKKVRTELDLNRRDTIPDNYLAQLRPIQAQIALGQLDHIDSDSQVRIGYARLYQEGLKDLPELLLPPPPDGESHIYTYFPIQYKDRQALLKWLMAHNCDVAAQHLKNTADLPSFKEFYRDCPNARATADQVIILPTYPSYAESEVRRNIEVIHRFFKKS